MKGQASDRPVTRRLIRLGFQLLRGRAHWQDTFPGLRIDRASGEIRYFGRKVGQLVPAALPSIDALHIIGSGPSLAGQNLTALPPARTILLNGAISLADQLHPAAVFVEDERFVFRHFSMLSRLDPAVPLALSAAVIRAILQRDDGFLQGRRVMLIDNLLKPVHHLRRRAVPAGVDGTGLVSQDPEQGVMIAGSVACTALQFALAAQPKVIGFAGIDLSNANAPRFYESADSRAPSGIVSGLPRLLAFFAAARDVAQERGIALRCYSARSALLEIGYPYDDLLDQPRL
ncbi:glycosyl transferase [Ketogulonicigenium vulgare]|uniref:glycosyl transferase n=1 Tax=Ketogulonicigenium vulgare TaxID=92945 RepID=UPI00235850B6|nr:glycosyl transferase [Ketogulonicigenium vulgare]